MIETVLSRLRRPWPPDPERLVADLRRLPGWDEAVAALDGAHARWAADTRSAVRDLATRFVGRRPALVFQAVITSGLRRSSPFIEAAAAAFEASPAAASLQQMAHLELPNPYRVKVDKLQTMQAVAAGLHRFAAERGLDDDAAATAWARAAVAYELEVDAEPYVGGLPGVDEVTFAFLRRGCGADTVRPDRRLWEWLQHLGFPLPGAWLTPEGRLDTVVVATAAAAQLGIPRAELDETVTREAAGLD